MHGPMNVKFAYKYFSLIGAQNRSWPCVNYKNLSRWRTVSPRTAAYVVQ